MDGEGAEYFAQLPVEMIDLIRALLDPPSRVTFALVSKTFRARHEIVHGSWLRGRKFSLECALAGHLNLLHWLLDDIDPTVRLVLRWSHAAAASRGGHVHVLKFLKEQGVEMDYTLAEIAAEGAHQGALDYFLSLGIKFRVSTFYAIGASGDASLVQWAELRTHFLSRLRPNVFAAGCFSGAVERNRRPLLEHLNANWNLGRINKYLARALNHGNIQLAEWLWDRHNSVEHSRFCIVLTVRSL